MTSGQGRDLHGVQHDLHCLVRVPQAVIDTLSLALHSHLVPLDVGIRSVVRKMNRWDS
jgi:hypothetical protein